MTSKTTDPRPAATEAAMMSNEELIKALLTAERMSVYAQFHIDPVGQRKFNAERDACQRELLSRLAAAPPSGQVDCDAVATVLDGYFPPDIVAHIITEARAAAPPSGQVCVSVEDLAKVQDALVAADVRISSERAVTKAKLATAYDLVTAALKGAAR